MIFDTINLYIRPILCTTPNVTIYGVFDFR
nr:MAG TPA: hypothetical protein [Caudoviricetes sp.]